MRVLTVKQPWAWAIVHGGKDVENRSVNIAGSYRGPVAIHAALHWDPIADSRKVPPALRAAMDAHRHEIDTVQDVFPWGSFGAVLGVVDLVGAHRALGWNPGEVNQCGLGSLVSASPGLCSSWAEQGCWHLELARPRPLSEPIPFRGALGLRRLSADVVASIEGALG